MKNKKQKRNLYTTSRSSDMEYAKIIKIAVGVVLILGLTYFITAWATGEINFGKKDKKEEVETAIQYEEIIAGQIFNRSTDNYYVMLFNFTDNYASYYLSLKDSYSYKENTIPFYIVDLEKHMNKELVLEENEQYNKYPSSVADLKVSNPTIIKISNKKVVERIEGKENVLKFFKEN